MTNKTTVLIVEDEAGISNFMSTMLIANDYRVIAIDNGHEAISVVSSNTPDLILLDLGLPDMDGLEVLRILRGWTSTPVIVVSARGRENEKVQALDLGADDYIMKPFGTSELLARIRTAIRHNQKLQTGALDSDGIYSVGDFIIDYTKRLVSVGKKEVHMTQIEYKILTLLAKYAGRVLTYDFIINEVWGPFGPKDNQILRVNMANIRRKIEKNPGEPVYVLTEVGVGYRMIEELPDTN